MYSRMSSFKQITGEGGEGNQLVEVSSTREDDLCMYVCMRAAY